MIPDVFLPLAIGLAITTVTMSVLWLVQCKTRNAGIVDVAWSALVGVVGVLYAAWPGGIVGLRIIVGSMIAIWSLRLTTYLFRRVIGHPEEGRYKRLRDLWGDDANKKLFFFFQAQALAACAFATPVLVIARSPDQPALSYVVLAFLLWSVGVLGVAAADRQLEEFKSTPNTNGKTCRQGLWKYSRHPNYFFEWVHWCSYIPLALGSVYWWVPAIVATGLLGTILFITGIPPTEAQALRSRGDDYRHYQHTTSVFVPWFPKTRS